MDIQSKTRRHLHKLAGGQTFTELDLSHAYEMLVEEDSNKHLTTNTHKGLYRYKKCQHMKPSLECLGHRVDKEGFHPAEAKVKAIKEALVPTNVLN